MQVMLGVQRVEIKAGVERQAKLPDPTVQARIERYQRAVHAIVRHNE